MQNFNISMNFIVNYADYTLNAIGNIKTGFCRFSPLSPLSTAFHDFHHFPPLSTAVCHFLPLSTAFCCFLLLSATFLNFPHVSAAVPSPVCCYLPLPKFDYIKFLMVNLRLQGVN